VISRFCEQEVDHAIELNNRIVPLLLEQCRTSAFLRRCACATGPSAMADVERGVERPGASSDTDLEWTKQHTSWLLKALEWEARGRERSFLLRGPSCGRRAPAGGGVGQDPEPTTLLPG